MVCSKAISLGLPASQGAGRQLFCLIDRTYPVREPSVYVLARGTLYKNCRILFSRIRMMLIFDTELFIFCSDPLVKCQKPLISQTCFFFSDNPNPGTRCARPIRQLFKRISTGCTQTLMDILCFFQKASIGRLALPFKAISARVPFKNPIVPEAAIIAALSVHRFNGGITSGI